MSAYSMTCLKDRFDFDASQNMSSGPASLPECIDPQYTQYDGKRSGAMQFEYMPPNLSDPYDIMTPMPSPGNDRAPHPPLQISETRGPCLSGQPSATSFESSPGSLTPHSAGSAWSNSSSRRQSMMEPGGQQYCLPTTSSSPSGPKRKSMGGHLIVDSRTQEPFLHDEHMSYTNSLAILGGSMPACRPEDETFITIDEYPNTGTLQWPNHQSTSTSLSTFSQNQQIEESASLSIDLTVNPHISLAPTNIELNPGIFSDPPNFDFNDVVPQQTPVSSQTTSDPGNPILRLQSPFQCGPREYNPDALYVDDDDDDDGDDDDNDISYVATPGVFHARKGRYYEESPRHTRSNRRAPPKSNRNPRSNPLCWPGWAPLADSRDKFRCQEKSIGHFIVRRGKERPKGGKKYSCAEAGCEGYSCNRPEHLKRHEQEKHMGDRTKYHKCKFPNCLDKKTGKQREIKARLDNLKAHYSKTHFRYGSTEKGGKNKRRSMKAAQELGLGHLDHRWDLLVKGEISMDHSVKDNVNVWKMLGYSILETKQMTVKDVPRNLEGPDTTSLKAFDPRWAKLESGTLSFEQAMNVGCDMLESEEQGLLGVTMLETKEMGVDHWDPRWKELRSGQMSVEVSKKLGVKHIWLELARRRKTF